MREHESGFTLVEVMIALVLFALIGLAGFSLLNAMIGVETRTDRRLGQLADLQRALYVITLDFEQQLADRSISLEGSKAVISRHADAKGGGVVVVEYDVANSELRRRLIGVGERSADGQLLLPNVTALRWEFFDRSAGWIETWPPPGAQNDSLPQAIAAVLTLSDARGGLSGILRRVVRLPQKSLP